MLGKQQSESGSDEEPDKREHSAEVITDGAPLPRIAGYELQRQIGRGGSATVYLAREIKHDRLVALKVLHPALAASLQAERFLREISIIAKLAHPNILPLLDSGSVGEQLYYVTPYVAGESLRGLLERGTRLSLEDALRLTREVAQALDYAHRQGLVHRDVKPENILLADGHAFVTDFGIARALSLAVDDRLTTSGIALGTPRYMSPEQATASAMIDGRSDIYSLACVLFELLSGSSPFDGATATEIMSQHSSAPVPSVRALSPSVPAGLERVLQTALAKDPGARFATAASLAEALEYGLTPTASWRAAAAIFKRPIPVLGAVVASAAIVAVLVYGLVPNGTATTRLPSGAVLDTTRLVVFPVARQGEGPTVIDVLLNEAIAAWRGVSLVDQFRVTEGLERTSGSLTVSAAGRLAATLGAGRFILVRSTRMADSSRVDATLYDVRGLTPLHSSKASVPADPTRATREFARVAQQLLLRTGPTDSLLLLSADASLPAVQAFGLAQHALSRWDLVAADSALRTALGFDPLYVRANLWLAQTRLWRGLAQQDWASLAVRATAGRAQLSTREQELAMALVSLSESRFADACRVYDGMRRRNDREFVAWYGLGQCRSLDPGVVRDSTSPSRWRMRSSIHAATQAYEKAFEILPSTYAGYELDDFDGLRSLLRVGNSLVRARAVPPDTGEFLARLAFRDSLVLVPYPFAVIRAGGAASVPPGFTEALSDRVAALSRIAAGWSAAFPNRAGPKQAVAIALEMQGSRAAIDTFVLARRLTSDPTRRARLAAREVLVRFRFANTSAPQSWRALRALADSQLFSTEWSADAASEFSSLAAITGRCDLAERLSRLTTFRRGAPVPEHLVSALDLHLSRAALACPVGPSGLNLGGLVSMFDDESRSLGAREQIWLQAAMQRPLLLAPVVDSALVERLVARGDSTPLLLAARAVARHNTAEVQAQLAAAQRLASGGLTTPDMAFFAANLALAVGDTLTTVSWLDRSLSGIGTYDRNGLSDHVKAATLVRSMALRADIAARSGDRETARRWGQVVALLWSGADAELQPVARRMAQYAGRN